MRIAFLAAAAARRVDAAPGLRGATGETRPKMLAIGESDRMTMLFRKRD